MYDLGFVCVDTSNMQVYDYENSCTGYHYNSKDELLAKAEARRQEDIICYKEYIQRYPANAEYWAMRLQEAEKRTFIVFESYDKYVAAHNKFFCDEPMTEITEDVWNDMFQVLPVFIWCTIDGVEMFCNQEMFSMSITNQFAKYNGKFYTKKVDITDKETWIHKRIHMK